MHQLTKTAFTVKKNFFISIGTQYYFNTPLELQMFKLRRMKKEAKLDAVVDRLMNLAKKPTSLVI